MTGRANAPRVHEHQHHHEHDHDSGVGDCDACPLVVNRRAFLRGAALAALGSVAAAAAATPLLADAVRSIAPVAAIARTRSYRIPTADGVSIDEANEVILVRWRGRAYAFSSRCTHKGAKLQWRADEGRIYCPKHKARFHPDGAHDRGRRTRALDRYPIARDGDALVVDLDTLYTIEAHAAAWTGAVVTLG